MSILGYVQMMRGSRLPGLFVQAIYRKLFINEETTTSHFSFLSSYFFSSQREAKIPSELAELEKTSKEPVSSFTEAPKKQISIQKTSDVKLQKDTKNKLINSLPSVRTNH